MVGVVCLRIAAAGAGAQGAHGTGVGGSVVFKTAAACTACHTGLTAASGEDISIAIDWRGSMMANSSRDPYWQAAVRRETMDHPRAAAEIEDECAVCHMPMSRAQSAAAGRKGKVFAHLAVSTKASPLDALAQDGVSCTLCHQISAAKLGAANSFTGGFVVERATPAAAPRVFGPFEIDQGRMAVMQSASGFQPSPAAHIRQSEMCATCHTLYTNARGASGEIVARFPEQVPYLEWRHSAFPAERQTCQTCHMPAVAGDTAMASVLGQPRSGVARHSFRGSNVFMLRLLNRYRGELGVTASSADIERAVEATTRFLRDDTASLTIDLIERAGGRLHVDVTVTNRAGHKLPTGYPARRAWIDFAVKDQQGRILFRSGEVSPDGAIAGNDNDADPSRFEPHHDRIEDEAQVQIYESVMAAANGSPTTGLLQGVRYAKDNRLLPRGFDKRSAHPDTAVVGAENDPSFEGGRDRIRYSVPVAESAAPLTVEAVLRFQPIGFRWAKNLEAYDAPETRRFMNYYAAGSREASEVLTRATAVAK